MATEIKAAAAAASPVDQDYRHGFHDSEDAYRFKSAKGLNREIVERISAMKNEPEWMLKFRLKAYETFRAKPMPEWGDKALLEEINFDDIHYFVKAGDRAEISWDDVPADIKRTFDRLGIPEAERKFLSGVSAQYESEVVYHSVREDLAKDGVIFCDWTRRYASTRSSSRSISRPSFRSATTSSPPSTRRCGRAARSSTYPPASK